MATTTTSALTFEEIDKHIQGIDFKSLQSSAVQGAGGTGAAVPNLCAAYKAIRPILVLLTTLVLLPQKWRDALKAFVQILDSICP